VRFSDYQTRAHLFGQLHSSLDQGLTCFPCIVGCRVPEEEIEEAIALYRELVTKQLATRQEPAQTFARCTSSSMAGACCELYRGLGHKSMHVFAALQRTQC
jgi:hypothetical protein